MTEFRLSEPAQQKRILIDAKTHKERLIWLLSNAKQYRKAWQDGTLNQLSDCFLNLQILDIFYVPHRPSADPHKQFAHHLTKVIAFKLGAISGLIKQIEATANPTTSTETAPTEHKEYNGGPSKKPVARRVDNFTDKLQNGFTEADLNNLLIHVNFKNKDGQTIKFTKYLMHHVIDALIKEDYFERGNVEHDQKALSRYLGIEETRVTVEQGKSKKSVQKKAESYLSELQNQRKINR